MSSGFYKRRRGILEHIEAGEIDLLESGIHDYLSLKANLVIGSLCSIPVGVVYTSAPAIHAHCKRVSERTIQRILEHLEAIGWLKMFKTPGKRGNYPTLLCRASVHDLSGNEYRINGVKTTDWQHPVYEPVGEVSGSCPESVGKLSGDREVRAGKKEEESNAVRRPVDAELPTSVPPSKGASRLKKKQNLTARLAKAIRVNGNRFKGGLDRDEYAVLQAAVNAMKYAAKDSTVITDGFTCMLMEVYEKHKNDGTSPGNLCSKVIDRCLSQQESCKTLGSDPSDYYWPPDFRDHRDYLRAKERATEKALRTSAAAHASAASARATA